MNNFKSFKSQLHTLNAVNVEDIALRLFQYQAQHNPVYSQYLEFLNIRIGDITSVADIPFIPISFFKNHILKTGTWGEEIVFNSSGTTGLNTSSHFIHDLKFYEAHSEECFSRFLGPLNQYHFLALMPSYLQQKNSSLITMMKGFMNKSKSADSRFYLDDYDQLLKDLKRLIQDKKRKIILWGVSYALLDLAEKFSPDLSSCIVFETGGMKGRRKEITREELHFTLKKHFNVDKIYSEYGMTELLSQAYTQGGSVFYPPPSMKIIVRDILDPFEKGLVGRPGGINVIDFANFHSAAFIETEDIGKVFNDGSFEVIGRLDNSDIRGCNLLVE